MLLILGILVLELHHWNPGMNVLCCQPWSSHVYITNYVCTLIFFTHMCVFTIYVDRKKLYVIIDKILRILWLLYRLQEISRMIAWPVTLTCCPQKPNIFSDSIVIWSDNESLSAVSPWFFHCAPFNWCFLLQGSLGMPGSPGSVGKLGVRGAKVKIFKVSYCSNLMVSFIWDWPKKHGLTKS